MTSGSHRWIVSSFPRVFTTMIQCSFGTYFWEMYTMEFGWSPAEWGTVQTIFNNTQLIIFIFVGLLLMAVDVVSANPETMKTAPGELLGYNILLVLVTTCHSHSLFGETSNFWKVLFTGPVDYPGIMSDPELKYDLIALHIILFPLRLVWILLYPFMKLFWMLIRMSCGHCILVTFRGLSLFFKGIFWYILWVPMKVIWAAMATGLWRLNPRSCTGTCKSPCGLFRGLSHRGIYRTQEFQGSGNRSKLVGLSQISSSTINTGPFNDWTALRSMNTLKKSVLTTSESEPSIAIGLSVLEGTTRSMKDRVGSLVMPLSHTPKSKIATVSPPFVYNPMPDMPMDLDPKQYFNITSEPPPALPTTKWQAMRAFMKTRKFTVYTLTVSHGVCMCIYEIVMQGLPAKTVAPKDIGNMISVNMIVFTISNLLVIWLFSGIRYWWSSKSKISQCVVIVGVISVLMNMLLCSASTYLLNTPDPNSPPEKHASSKAGVFYKKVEYQVVVRKVRARTTNDTNLGYYEAKDDGSGITNNKVKEVGLSFNIARAGNNLGSRRYVHLSTDNTKPPDNQDLKIIILQLVQLLCLMFMHSTVFFWIFTGGPLTFYVSTKIMNDNHHYRSWGVPAILVGFAFMQNIPGGFALKGTNPLERARVPTFSVLKLVNSGSGTTTHSAEDTNVQADATVDAGSNGKPSTNAFKKAVADAATDTKDGDEQATGILWRRILLIVVAIMQFDTLLVFFPFNYWWNPKKWFNYFILSITGGINTLWLSYTYVCIGLSIGTRDWRMLYYGFMYALTQFVVSTCMGVMFRSFGADEIKRCCRFNYHYCFPTVYKGITLFLWIINILSVFGAISSSIFIFDDDKWNKYIKDKFTGSTRTNFKIKLVSHSTGADDTNKKDTLVNSQKSAVTNSKKAYIQVGLPGFTL